MNLGKALRAVPYSHMFTPIGLFLIASSLFWLLRPGIAFTPSGGARPFGTSHPGGTIFPVWWWTLILAIASYCAGWWLGG